MKNVLSNKKIVQTSSVATGGFGGLDAYTNPRNWNMKHYKSVEFL